MDVRTIYCLAFANLFSIALVIPLIQPSFLSLDGGTILVAGILESICAGLQFTNAPLVGSWSDNAGRKKVLVYTLTLVILSNVLLGFSTSVITFFIARILEASFHHVQLLLKAVVADHVPENAQASVFNKMGALAGLAFVAGPVIGGHLHGISGDLFYIAILVNVLHLLVIGVISLTLENQVAVTKKEKSPGIIANIKQINWAVLWDVFALKLVVELGFALWRSSFALLAREIFEIPTKSMGYVIGFLGICMITASILMSTIRKKFYGNDKDRMNQLRHGLLVFWSTILGMALTGHFTMYLLFFVSLAFSKVLLDSAFTEMILSRAKDKDKGVVLGVLDSVMQLSLFVSPLIMGIFGQLFSLNAVLYLPVIPLPLSLLVLSRFNKSKQL